MPIKSALASLPAARTQDVLARAGSNLRLARIRRRMTLSEVADRLGVDRRTVSALEAGAPQVAASVLAGALWAYGLERDFEALADPERDSLGKGLEARERRQVARKRVVVDDF